MSFDQPNDVVIRHYPQRWSILQPRMIETVLNATFGRHLSCAALFFKHSITFHAQKCPLRETDCVMFHWFMILLSTGRLKGSTRYGCSTPWCMQWKTSIHWTAYRHNTGMLKTPQYRTFACRRIFSPLRMTLFNPKCHHIIRLWDSALVSPVNQSSMWPFEFSWPLHWLALE